MQGKSSLTVSQDLRIAPDAILDALGDRTRRRILERLRNGPLAVVEISRDLPVSRPAVSQHLRVLKDAGLVSDRTQGNRRLYSVDPNGLALLRAFLDLFWAEALGRFVEVAEGRSPIDVDG